VDRVRVLWFAFLGLWSLTLLYFGAVRPWAIAATCGAMAVLFGLSLVLLKEPLRLSRWGVGFLAAFAGLFVLQLLPLPFLFPYTTRLREAHGVGIWWPGTADTWRTLLFIAQFASYTLAGLFVLKLRQAGLSSKVIVKSVLAVLSLEAAFGLVRLFAGWERPPFFDGPPAYPGCASGTLVNRNSFAGLMGIGFVLAAAVAMARFTWPARRGNDEGRPTLARRIEAGLGWALLVGLFAVTIVLSKSRGGAFAALVGACLIPFFHRGRASLVGGTVLILIAAVGVLAANPAALLERFGALDPFEVGSIDRITLWESTIMGGMNQPIMGFGFGSHPEAYHPFQPLSITGQAEHAHNEYVNVFFEAGLAGVVLVLAALAAWYFHAWRGLRALPGPDRLRFASALAAVSVIVLHSIVDFDLRITSIGLAFGVMIGLGASLSRSPKPRPRFGWMALVDGLAVAFSLFLLPLDPGGSVAEGSEPRLAQTLGLSPFHHGAAWKFARSAEARGDLNQAAARFERAAALHPAKGPLQLEAGLWFWNSWATLGQPEGLDRAGKAFARYFEQQPSTVTEVMGDIWTRDRPLAEYEKLLPPTPAAAGEFAAYLVEKGSWEQAHALFEHRVAQDLESLSAFDRFAGALHEAGQWGLEASVRDRRLEISTDAAGYAASSMAWFRLGFHERALEKIHNAVLIDPVNPGWLRTEAEVLLAMGKEREAFEALSKAVALAPTDATLRLRRAGIAAGQRIYTIAIEDYRTVLEGEPEHRSAELGLIQTLADTGDRGAARARLEKWLVRYPQDRAGLHLKEILK
jgi:tetratricopeptide (TPR) repeat protein/O-antigen ligase